MLFQPRELRFCLLFVLIPFYISAQKAGSIIYLEKSTQPFCVVSQVNLEGNKKTKPYIILRELNFSKGDTISSLEIERQLERSRQNILNTSLFNLVDITVKQLDSNKVDIGIKVTERWYIFPVPVFEITERNFNTWWETKNLQRASYGFYIIKENFRGRKESIIIRFRLGYSEQYGFSYQIPYLDKKQRNGLSISSYYYRGHELFYKTENNQLVFYKDPDHHVRNEYVSRIAHSYRQGLYNSHTTSLRYNSANITDTILSLNPYYFTNNQSNIQFLSAGYYFRRDFRDYKIYPLRGYFFDFEINKLGLGILKKESVDIVNISSSFRKFWKLGERFYFASSIDAKYSPTAFQPYYTQRALGYDDYVRGYEYYVIDGSSYALMKAGIKYQLVKPHIQKIPYLNAEKFDTFHYAFYLELFSDWAYVDNQINYQNNSLANSHLFGSGLGISLVTYYDNVFRIEYSFNRLKESGIFLHLNAPI